MKTSHATGVTGEGQVLFCTPFGYMFRDAAGSPGCLLPATQRTIDGLLALGTAMADPGTQDHPTTEFDSDIPAGFTYFGQFIDHDLTARTDREAGDGGLSISDGRGNVNPGLAPLPPAEVVTRVFNARRPQLDLDSVYGDGPSLIDAGAAQDGVVTRSDHFYKDLRLLVERGPGRYLDLPRRDGVAQIADERNDENLIVSQLHATMLAFNNKVFDGLNGSTVQGRYSQARRLVRWAYQYAVVNDFLMRVCDPSIVEDTVMNGPRFYSPAANGGAVFMPLEFSVAGFRFAHSMIRPFYKLNDDVTRDINDILEPRRDRGDDSLLGVDRRLKPKNVVAWRNFVDLRADVFGGPQSTRLIDPRLALGLFRLGFDGLPDTAMMSHLTQRNLLRGHLFSIPTGQAVAEQMGIQPLSEPEVLGDDDNIAQAIRTGGFEQRTPLWYYILQEAKVQAGGRTLGAVGSRLVAETVVGLLKADPNSYLRNQHHPAVTGIGIAITAGDSTAVVSSLADIIRFADVRK
ncbi:heme peroxidase family protein [Thalassobaculum sp.]|uniref:peroxidase family protein n=1 Tax=Thalassobaculum sp. TaxID=2022740 RepID=UPI0032EB6C31